MNIAQRPKRTITTGDRRWVTASAERASRHNVSITLDVSLFEPALHYPDGYLPGGLILGEVAASPSVHGIYGGGTDEVQQVTITGSPTGGSFTLTFEGQTTAAIAFNASAATVRAALEALSNVAVGEAVVTGGPGPATPWSVRFTGSLGDADRTQMTADGTGLTGGSTPAVAVTTTTAGTANAVSDGRQTAVGLLWADVPVVGPDGTAFTRVGGSLLWSPCAIDTAFLPANSGLDAAARVDLAARNFKLIDSQA